MADPLSVSASVLGIAVPALHGLRLLLDDLRRLKSAPSSIKRLTNDLEACDQAHQSLEAIPKDDLRSLGKDILDQITRATETCEQASKEFHKILRSWTKHSKDGTLSWRDKTNMALFADKEATAISNQLQSIKTTFISIVSLATLHVSLKNRDKVERLNQSSPNSTQGNAQPLTFVFSLPFRRDGDFVDRVEMAQLESKMSARSAHAALVGLGGVGKSQLAIEYCYRLRQNLSDTTVLWIRAGDAARYTESLYDIAGAAKIKNFKDPATNIFQLIHDWLLHEVVGDWIIVLDGLDDANFFLAPLDITNGDESTIKEPPSKCMLDYIPNCERGKLLISTRSRRVAAGLVDYGDLIDVPVMDTADAMNFLARKLYEDVSEEISLLAKELDCVPLAMAQAAAYLQKMRPLVTPQQLLNDIQERRVLKEKLLTSEIPQNLRRDRISTNSVFLTWRIAFEHIKNDRPTAANLLSVLSYFNCVKIPISMLSGYCANIRNHYSEEKTVSIHKDAGAMFLELSSTDLEHQQDLCYLQDFMLIKIDTVTMSLQMHDLVQVAIREWLKINKTEHTLSFRASLQMFEDELPEVRYENSAHWMSLFPHAMKITEHELIEDNKSLLYWSRIAEQAVWYAVSQSFMKEAQLLYNRLSAVEARVATSGQNETIMRIASGIAAFLRTESRWLEVEQRHKFVLAKSKELYGEKSPRTWTAMSNLATTAAELGRWSEAKTLYEEVLELRINHFGKTHQATLTSMFLMATISARLGDYKSAQELYEKLLTIHTTSSGPEHPDSISAMSELAVVHYKLGNFEKGVEYGLEVVLRRTEILGPNHRSTINGRANLALNYLGQARWEEAESIMQDLLDIAKDTFGNNHLETASRMVNLAVVVEEKGNIDLAESLERQALEIRKTALPKNHPQTLHAMVNLATTLREQGKYDEAIEMTKEVVDVRQSLLGEAHPETWYSLSLLSTLHWHKDRFDKAADIASSVLEARRKHLGDMHPDTLTSMCNLAKCKRSQGQLEEAESLANDAIERGEEAWGKEHPYRIVAMANLAETYVAQGRLEQAKTLWKEVVELRTRILGPDHPDTMISVKNLARLMKLDEDSQ